MGARAAARILGVTRRHVLRMVAAGRLQPVAKLDGDTGAYLFDPAEVERVKVERSA